VHIFDDVNASFTAGERIDDKRVGDPFQDRGPQILPSPDDDERMLRAQNDCQVRKKLTREISDDVHDGPDRLS